MHYVKLKCATREAADALRTAVVEAEGKVTTGKGKHVGALFPNRQALKALKRKAAYRGADA